MSCSFLVSGVMLFCNGLKLLCLKCSVMELSVLFLSLFKFLVLSLLYVSSSCYVSVLCWCSVSVTFKWKHCCFCVMLVLCYGYIYVGVLFRLHLTNLTLIVVLGYVLSSVSGGSV